MAFWPARLLRLWPIIYPGVMTGMCFPGTFRPPTARYPNVHIFQANRIFAALIKYPYSIFYDEGILQAFSPKRAHLGWLASVYQSGQLCLCQSGNYADQSVD